MTPRGRALAIAGYAAAVVGAFWTFKLIGAGRLGGGDDAAAKQEASQRGVLNEVRTLRERKPKVDAAIQSYVDRTLGGTLEEVDGTLRARLNRLGESEGLRSLAVSTGANSARESPARSAYSRAADLKKLRDEVDFVSLQGTISGEASVEQVLRLLQRIEAEPWLKRIDTVRLDVVRGEPREGKDPKESKERRKGPPEPRLRMTIAVTTIFLPGRAPAQLMASQWKPDDVAKLAPLTQSSLFVVPAPPAPPPVVVDAAPTPPPPPSPPPFAYDQWTLTGIARGTAGVEVWLTNRANGERRVLAAGQALHEMVLAQAGGERAEFMVGERTMVVEVGQSMASAIAK